ncbi:hypothetical protein My1_030 [Pectobacterium phage My1]|uniref:Uncharacterized protein n=1 Tax=Pectobacterium phage My1 TaxID=1204539 RepID=J9QKX8_9CAUD|nr:hypothetical protein My1_030 [Pectobacterium phage My1]AFQ22189.1 hypothetical protein My1_030 [Pectobacterium phage My1]
MAAEILAGLLALLTLVFVGIVAYYVKLNSDLVKTNNGLHDLLTKTNETNQHLNDVVNEYAELLKHEVAVRQEVSAIIAVARDVPKRLKTVVLPLLK